MTVLRHPIVRRLLAGLLLSGLATWLLPPTVRASMLTASAAEPWLRHGRVDDASADDAPPAPLDEQLQHHLVQTVAGVLSLQGALSTTGGTSLNAGPPVDKAAGVGARIVRPVLPHAVQDDAARAVAGVRPAALVRALSAARPMGP